MRDSKNENNQRQRSSESHLPARLGPCLRLLRTRKGLSQIQLWREGHRKSDCRLGEWEIERRKISAKDRDFFVWLDDRLDAGGYLLGLFDREIPAPKPSQSSLFGCDPWTLRTRAEWAAIAWYRSQPDAAIKPFRRERRRKWADTENKNAVAGFLAFLVACEGISQEKLTLALLADRTLIRSYVHHCTSRLGAPTSETKRLVTFAESLLGPETGLFHQLPVAERVLANNKGEPSRTMRRHISRFLDFVLGKERRASGDPSEHRYLVKFKDSSAFPIGRESRWMFICERTADDLEMLRRELTRNIERRTPGTVRLDQLLPPIEALKLLLECARKLSQKTPPRRRRLLWAIHIRRRLEFELLTHHPEQRASFVFLELADLMRFSCPKHAGKGAACTCSERPWQIVHRGKHPWSGRLCKYLWPLLDLYIYHARPILVGRGKSRWLLVSKTGGQVGNGRSRRLVVNVGELLISLQHPLLRRGVAPISFQKIREGVNATDIVAWEQVVGRILAKLQVS